VILIPLACLLALASCLCAGPRRGRAYLDGASARAVLPLDVLTLVLAVGAIAASVGALAPDEDSGVALLVIVVGEVSILPLAARAPAPARARAVCRLAVAVILNSWAVITGLSVGAFFTPAGLAAASAVVFGVWTIQPGAAPR
jgi:hypothetical protein